MTYHKILIYVTLLMTGLLMASCDSLIYEEQGDCTPQYALRLKYDHNIKFADALANEVTEVSVYFFDPSGTLVYTKTEGIDRIAANDNRMTVEVAPGLYDIVAWGHGHRQDGTGFSYSGAGTPAALGDIHRSLERKPAPAANGNAMSFVDTDLHGLYHARVRDAAFPDEEGLHETTLSFVKDTNVIRVLLQQINGHELNADDFDFYLTSENGSIDPDNRLKADEVIAYRAWSKKSGMAGMDLPDDRNSTIERVSAVVAEMTTSRLVLDRPVTLVVTHRDRPEPIIRIPVMQYALMVKGNFRKDMSDQEYLDRQDEYPMAFFLDDNHQWATQAGIYINSWHVVLNDTPLN